MNTFGRKFKVSVFGESHGRAIGVVLDGVPAGLEVCEEDFKHDVDRRRSGAKGTTPRKESDLPVILSGVYEGHATGAPLTIIFRNEDVRSQDYGLFAAMPRPGHADMTAAFKWEDCQDPRGGGHFSGRMTLAVVAAGVVAKKILKDVTILNDTPCNNIDAQVVELGGVPKSETEDLWQQQIDKAIEEGDSLGAVVECVVPEIDPGYGEPFWDSVEAVLAHGIFSIPGVRGIEFGDGFKAAAMRGSEHNDPIGEDGRPLKNGAGGANGGITNGAPLSFRVAFKPTSSISRPQRTYNFASQQMDTLEIPGRHDACFALRAPVVVEAMTAIVLADFVLLSNG